MHGCGVSSRHTHLHVHALTCMHIHAPAQVRTNTHPTWVHSHTNTSMYRRKRAYVHVTHAHTHAPSRAHGRTHAIRMWHVCGRYSPCDPRLCPHTRTCAQMCVQQGYGPGKPGMSGPHLSSSLMLPPPAGLTQEPDRPHNVCQALRAHNSMRARAHTQ